MQVGRAQVGVAVMVCVIVVVIVIIIVIIVVMVVVVAQQPGADQIDDEAHHGDAAGLQEVDALRD